MLALQLLLEGNSIRSTARITDLDQNTIMKALVLAGERAERVMADKIRNVQVGDVECDEAWSWIYEKQKRVRPEDSPLFGDCYVWVGIERHSKLVLNVTLGKRDQQTCNVFRGGIASRDSPHAFSDHNRWLRPLSQRNHYDAQRPHHWLRHVD